MKRRITLVEVLAAGLLVVIVGALLIAFPRMAHQRISSRVAGCISNLHNIGAGAEMYLADFNAWPAGLTSGCRLGVLRHDYVDSTDMFDCPASDTVPDYSSSRRAFLVSDYYLDAPIASDADFMRAAVGDHNLDGKNHPDRSVILFVDTHVKAVKLDQGERYPNPYLSQDRDMYALDSNPRDINDADLD